MRIILLVLVATLVILCNTTDLGTEGKGLRGRQDGLWTNSTELAMAEAIAVKAKWRDYNASSNKFAFKSDLKRGTERYLFQKDIIITQKQVQQITNDTNSRARSKRHVVKDFRNKSAKWPNGVFYTFNTSDPTVQKLFKMGISVWSENTCIDFEEDKSAEDKVVVVKEAGCWSSNGRVGGEQLLSLGKDCVTEGTAVHEIGHALGLLHTMSRYDRDSFIRIVLPNVNPREMGEFTKVSRRHGDVYGLSYDYGSIMHYGELSSSINNKPTMMAKDPLYQMTMGSELIAFSDILLINIHYGCNEKCDMSTSAKCANEGYPHPRNCSLCICPRGYGGHLCDQRPPGCGENLVATINKQTVVSTLGFGSDLRDRFSFCNYMITAPEGKKIEIEVGSISDEYNEAGCPKGGVEVKAQADQKMTGYRFCSTKGSGGPIVSKSEQLPVIFFNRVGSLQATFSYRFVD